MTHKTMPRVEIKDADKGEIVAVFSTFGVIDSDGDVTKPGAFEDGKSVPMSAYGHQSWSGALPIGVGAIRSTKTEGIFEGRFFMDTQHGADTFRVVKELGDLQEYSYGLVPTQHSFGEHEGKRVRFLEKVRVDEVSPVLKGAGIGTRTLTVKGGLTFADHSMSVLADVKGLRERASEVVALRAEKGKDMSPATAELLRAVEAELKALADDMAVPATTNDIDELARREFARFVHLTMQGA